MVGKVQMLQEAITQRTFSMTVSRQIQRSPICVIFDISIRPIFFYKAVVALRMACIWALWITAQFGRRSVLDARACGTSGYVEPQCGLNFGTFSMAERFGHQSVLDNNAFWIS